jgi:CMP-N-acetylneuraminic acid synthetase
MKITAFLPCRKGSERVPNKNTRPFSGRAHGLLEIKLAQLLAVEGLDEIVVSSNDLAVLEYAEELRTQRIRTHRRADSLGSSTTSTDALVGHALDLIADGHILWTHVTSPFFGSRHYEDCLRSYRNGLEAGFDSLMTVTELHSFLWDQSGPVNYDRSTEKWPRTQTLAPTFEVNSAVFLHSAMGYRQVNDRIGHRPILHPSSKIAGFDIDWPEDFELAQAMLDCGIAHC